MSSPRNYGEKSHKSIIDSWRHTHFLPYSPPLSPNHSLPTSPPISQILDNTPMPPSPNSPNLTSSSLHPHTSIPNLHENRLHELLHLSNLLDINIQHVEKKCDYGYLKEIFMRRADQNQYKFKEGDFPDLHLNDIEGMLLLLTQNKLFNLEGDVIINLGAALRMFICSMSTLQYVHLTLLHRLKNFRLGYNPNFDMPRREWTKKD
ncbi:hypothetical protein Tco_0363938 [Tanacetum coccineum]